MGIMNLMTTKAQLQNDLKDALRAKDETSKRTLRMALAAIKNAEIDKGGELEETSVFALLQKEVKTLREVISESEHAQRSDLVAKAESEITILEAYLPQPFSPEELEEMAREAIGEVGATSPRQMGHVMKVLMPRVKARADGKQVNQLVRHLLE